jgi:hypothetical protein
MTINAGLKINSSPLASFNASTLAWDNILVTVVYPAETVQDFILNPISINDIVIDTTGFVWKVTLVNHTSSNNFTVSLLLQNSNPTDSLIPNIGDTTASINTLINDQVAPYWNSTYVNANVPRIANEFNVSHPIKLDSVSDVSALNPIDKQALLYDSITNTWKPGKAGTDGILFGNTLTGDAILESNKYYFVNTNNITLILPESPQIGNYIELYDSSNLLTNVVVSRNNNLIDTIAEDLIIDVSSFAIRLLFIGGTTGWHIYNISNVTNVVTDFSSLINKPTTLIGYGITDALTSFGLEEHSNSLTLHLSPLQNTWIDDITASSTEVNYLVGATASIQSQLNTKESITNKGTANGYVPLNSSSKIATEFLPDTILGQLIYKGVWNSSSNSPSIPVPSTSNKGWYYIVSTAGTTVINSITDWKVGDWIVSNGSSWDKVDNTDAISSINGQTGALAIDKTWVGLDNVENIALTTWTGSSNITTVGNLTTGTIPATLLGGVLATNLTQFLRADGSWSDLPATVGGVAFGGSLTSNTNLINKTYYTIATNNLTLTLPSTPSIGDYIELFDQLYSLTNITVNRNGQLIQSIADDLVLDYSGFAIRLLFIGGLVGWSVIIYNTKI